MTSADNISAAMYFKNRRTGEHNGHLEDAIGMMGKNYYSVKITSLGTVLEEFFQFPTSPELWPTWY